MVYGFAEGKQKLVKAPLLYIIVTIYAIMALAINNQQVEQNKSDDITVKIEEYFKRARIQRYCENNTASE